MGQIVISSYVANVGGSSTYGILLRTAERMGGKSAEMLSRRQQHRVMTVGTRDVPGGIDRVDTVKVPFVQTGTKGITQTRVSRVITVVFRRIYCRADGRAMAIRATGLDGAAPYRSRVPTMATDIRTGTITVAQRISSSMLGFVRAEEGNVHCPVIMVYRTGTGAIMAAVALARYRR